MKVQIGTSALTRDLVWCECGRGLSLSGKWAYCPKCGVAIDQESYLSAVEQAMANGASHFYRDPEDFERLEKIRDAMVAAFGGMAKGSAIWGQSQWEKGWTAGIQAALLAFDTERKK